MPVILIVYQPGKNVAYWLYFQSYFAKRSDFNLFTAGRNVSVRIPSANVVSPGAMRKFARFRDRMLAQMRAVIHDEA